MSFWLETMLSFKSFHNTQWVIPIAHSLKTALSVFFNFPRKWKLLIFVQHKIIIFELVNWCPNYLDSC